MKRVVVFAFAAILGVMAGGLVMALLVPRDPSRFGPGTAVLVTLACIAVLVTLAAIVTKGERPEQP